MATVRLLYGKHPLRTIKLDLPSVVVGRGEDAAIPIDDAVVSRVHCRIDEDEGGHTLVDLNSASGTFVAGSKVERVRLTDGDRIDLGRHTLVYSSGAVDAVWGHVREQTRDRVESAADFAAIQAIAKTMSTFDATRAATTNEVVNMREDLAAKQGPHMAWTTDDGKQRFAFGRDALEFEVGWHEAADHRLPGLKLFGKKRLFRVRLRGKRAEVEVLGGARDTVKVAGEPVRGTVPLEPGQWVEGGGARFRFVRGSRKPPGA